MSMPAEIEQEIGNEFGWVVEYFVPLPKPHVRLFGAAANGGGRPLANVVELSASKYHYNVEVELPQVWIYENEIEWSVNAHSEVTIEGQITPGEIFANRPVTGNKRNRVQLCPTEPWAISFRLPGPVEWWTAVVYTPSNNVIEISVVKRRLSAEPAATASTAFVIGAGSGPGPVGDTSLTKSEVMDMVEE